MTGSCKRPLQHRDFSRLSEVLHLQSKHLIRDRAVSFNRGDWELIPTKVHTEMCYPLNRNWLQMEIPPTISTTEDCPFPLVNPGRRSPDNFQARRFNTWMPMWNTKKRGCFISQVQWQAKRLLHHEWQQVGKPLPVGPDLSYKDPAGTGAHQMVQNLTDQMGWRTPLDCLKAA